MAHAHGHGHLHHRTGAASIQEPTFHVHPVGLYLRTLVALVILMSATVVFAQIPFPDLSLGFLTIHGTMINNVVAMAIAVTKAILVMNFFMGAKYSTRLTKLWVLAGFVGFALMFLVYGDYATRRYEPTPRWTNDPGSAMQRSVKESRTDPEFRKLDNGSGRF